MCNNDKCLTCIVASSVISVYQVTTTTQSMPTIWRISKVSLHFFLSSFSERWMIWKAEEDNLMIKWYLFINFYYNYGTFNNKSAAGIAWCPATALTSSEVTVLNLCTSSSHALYLYQVLRNYLEWYQGYMISILKITKGNNSAKRYNFHTNHIQNYEVAYNRKKM